MYLEFDGIYGTDRTVMEVEGGMIKRLLPPEERPVIRMIDDKQNDDMTVKNIGNEASVNTYRRIRGYAYPGFNDSHMHLIGLGKKLSTVDCVGCRSVEEVAERVSHFIAANSAPTAREKTARDGESDRDFEKVRNTRPWILGRGWNQDLFSEKRLPSRYDLDRVSLEIPIAIHRVCGHIAVLNTCALREAGLIEQDGGMNAQLIEKLRAEGGEVDIKDGEPTGILREFACDVIRSDYSLAELEDFVLKAQDYLFSLGITSVQTDDLYFGKNWRDVVNMFETMEREGRLKLSVYEQSQIKESAELLAEYRQSKSVHEGASVVRSASKGSHPCPQTDVEEGFGARAILRKKFRLGPLKILSDGSLGARTAYMTEPYADDPHTRGILAVSEEKLRELMFSAAKAGTDSVVHGIGDGVIEILLDINQEIRGLSLGRDSDVPDNRRGDGGVYGERRISDSVSENRNTIIHCQVMSAKQIDKMAAIGIGAMVQPIFLDYDLGIIESRVGADKARTSYAYRTMLDKGIRLAFGSDAPVEDPNPLMGIHFAVNRAEEAIELEEAIDAYTAEGAYFSYEEGVKGRLKEGYVADIAVFAEEIRSDNLRNNRCVATYVSGEKVYEAAESDSQKKTV